jgi:hypothetical protein
MRILVAEDDAPLPEYLHQRLLQENCRSDGGQWP